MQRLYVLLAICVMSLSTICAATGAEVNLVPNTSFEDGPEGAAERWQLNFWEPNGRRSAGDVSSEVAHTGRRSLHMNGWDPGSHAYWSTRELPAKAGQRYVLTAWVKLAGVMGAYSYSRIHIGFKDANGEYIADKDHPAYSGWEYVTIRGYRDWVQVGLETVSPPGTVAAGVTLRFVGAGDCWFDDVVLLASDTAKVPTVPMDIATEGTFSAPETCAGKTEVTLKIRNPYEEAVEGLVITGESPAGSKVATSEAVDIAPGQTATIPVQVSFPTGMNERDEKVVFVGSFQRGGNAETAKWRGVFSVMPADLLAAIESDKWGVNAAPEVEEVVAVDVLGVLLTRGGERKFYSHFNELDLREDDEALSVVARLTATDEMNGEVRVEWEALDYFFRHANGEMTVELPAGKSYLAHFDIPKKHMAHMWKAGRDSGGDRYRILCDVSTAGENVASGEATLRLKPELPTPVILPALGNARHDEVGGFGKLKLVDEIVAGTKEEPHQLRQGARGLFNKYTSAPLDYYGGGDRLTYNWAMEYRDERDEFVRVEHILGKPCFVVDEWGWFAFDMGRQLEKGKNYLLVIEYPEDISRNWMIWNRLDGGSCNGWHTGSALGDPHSRQRIMQKVDLPLSGEYGKWMSVFKAGGEHGWISVHTLGGSSAPFSHGAAVYAMRIYEIGDDEALEALTPEVTEPEGLPKRLMGFIQEDATPSTYRMARYAFWGINMYSPLTLSYGGGSVAHSSGFVGWDSKLYFEDLQNPIAAANPPYYKARFGLTEGVMKEADRLGMTVMPLLEYAGTGNLPGEALAVWPDGSQHQHHWGTTLDEDGLRTWKYGGDATQCINMAHPAVGEDLAKLMEDVTEHYGQYESYGGVVLTHRFQAWQTDYSRATLEMFAKDTGMKLPAENAGQWVYENKLDEYMQWHYRMKRLNLLQASEALNAADPDAKMLVLNYNGGDDNLHFGTPLYWWDKKQGDEFLVPGKVSLPDFSRMDLVKLMEDYRRPDIAGMSVGMDPKSYNDDEGIWNLAMAHYPFMCGNKEYLDAFKTGEGSAVCVWWIYNEDAFNNHRAIGWNCPGLNGNEPAGRYCMMDEVLAMAASDPYILAVRIGNVHRGFPEYAQEFSAAYRALPAVQSEIVEACADEDIVVRKYETAQGTYIAVIRTGLGPDAKYVSLDVNALGGTRMRNLVSGREHRGSLKLRVKCEPVSLQAFIAE